MFGSVRVSQDHLEKVEKLRDNRLVARYLKQLTIKRLGTLVASCNFGSYLTSSENRREKESDQRFEKPRRIDMLVFA